MTDEQHSYSRSKSSDLLSSKTITQQSDSTTEIGSLVAANDNTLLKSGADMTIKGTVSDGQNTALTSGGSLSIDALKNTAYSYYDRKKSGLSMSFSTSGKFSAGYGKSHLTTTGEGTNWTPSILSASQGDLAIAAGKAVNVTASALTVGRDLSISGSSVGFHDRSQDSRQTKSNKTFFVGGSLGVADDSLLGQALQAALAASQAQGKGSGMVTTLNAMEGAYGAGAGIAKALSEQAAVPATKLFNGIGKGKTPMGTNLAGVKASIGFNSSKDYSEQESHTVEGARATAGRQLNVVARGDDHTDKSNGDISLTATQLKGQDISLEAQKDIALDAGWDSSDSYSRSKSSSASVGVEASVGATNVGFSAQASFQTQKQVQEAHERTAEDSVISATYGAHLHAGNLLALNGAEVMAQRIEAQSRALSITSPQNISDFESHSMQAGAHVSVPIMSPGKFGLGGSFEKQNIEDHFASTENTLSGFYAGKEGLGIDVAGNTSLTAGVIASTADKSRNYLNTKSLTARNVSNISAWKSKSVGMSMDVGSDMMSSVMGSIGAIGLNGVANSAGMLGSSRKHDENSESQSAIGDNITINAQSQSGHYSRNTAHANGALENKFDAQKLQNQLQASQLGTQLVGQVIGRVADELGTKRDGLGNVTKAGIPGFDDGKLSDNWARIALEGGANAAIAALTGGNPAVAGASTVAGKVASIGLAPAIGRLSAQLFDDDKLGNTFGNALDNLAASGAGAIAGAAVSGGHGIGAWNGAVTASIIQQYNETAAALIQEAHKRGIAEDLCRDLGETEILMHMLRLSIDSYPDGEGEPYYKNGHINPNVKKDEEYTLPDLLKMGSYNIAGVKDEKSFVALMDRSSESSTAALFIAKDPNNPLTPSFVVFRGSDNALDFVRDAEQYVGIPALPYWSSPISEGPAATVGKAFFNTSIPNVDMGGNSLGGALGMIAGWLSHSPYVISNSAGLNLSNNFFFRLEGMLEEGGHKPSLSWDGTPAKSYGVVNGNEGLHILQNTLSSFTLGSSPATPQTDQSDNFISDHMASVYPETFSSMVSNHSARATYEAVKAHYFADKHKLEELLKENER